MYGVSPLPDITVYEMESGSYFASYNSLKQTRKPVLLIYCEMRRINMESVSKRKPTTINVSHVKALFGIIFIYYL